MKSELGRTGLNHAYGSINEEYLNELQGKRGIKIYREMSDNDATVAAMLFAIKMLVRQAPWHIQAASRKDIDLKAAEFVESCMDDMQSTWTDTISSVLSFLTYGWSLHEIVYKRRVGHRKEPPLNSKYSDGLIGWMKLPIRSQESLYEWDFDEHDNLMSFVQMPAPTFNIIKIPAEKFLLFRTENHKDNPEGRSILRSAYRAYYFKKRLEELEAVGVERDLAGFPVLIAPEGMDIWSDPTLMARCNEFVSNIRRDAMEGLTLPAGWELKLLSTGGARQFDTTKIIERYDTRIAQTVLADFLLLGHQEVGSYALSSDKTKLFSVAIGTFLDIICEVFNRDAIPRLIQVNEKNFSKISDYPHLEHGDLETAIFGGIIDILEGNCWPRIDSS